MTPINPETGLPENISVALFDLDGVLTATAAVHFTAWTRAFNHYLESLPDQGDTTRPFTKDDYITYVDGRPRADGVRTFLESRGLPADDALVERIGTSKNDEFLAAVGRGEAKAYPGSVRYLDAMEKHGVHIAVVTSSKNGAQVLDAADLSHYVEHRIDGNDIVARGLSGKPAPDSYLAGAEVMGVAPENAAVFEDAISGLQAGRAGHFGYVIGVNREGPGHVDAMRDAGADIVVDDLSELLGE
ncbi:HAD family hydrolase [Gordonia sp. NPDC003425]